MPYFDPTKDDLGKRTSGEPLTGEELREAREILENAERPKPPQVSDEELEEAYATLFRGRGVAEVKGQ